MVFSHVRPSVCPVARQQQRHAAGLLLIPAINRCLPLAAAWARAADIDRYRRLFPMCAADVYFYLMFYIWAKSSTVLCHNINKLTYLLFDRRRRQRRAAGGVVVVTRGGGGSTPTCRVYRLPAGRPALGPRQRGGSAR